MLKKVSEYMREQHMIEPGDRVIAGVSGGADSVCLLAALRLLQKELDFSLVCVHVNHGLRGAEAERDEAFVKAMRRLGDSVSQLFLSGAGTGG